MIETDKQDYIPDLTLISRMIDLFPEELKRHVNNDHKEAAKQAGEHFLQYISCLVARAYEHEISDLVIPKQGTIYAGNHEIGDLELELADWFNLQTNEDGTLPEHVKEVVRNVYEDFVKYLKASSLHCSYGVITADELGRIKITAHQKK